MEVQCTADGELIYANNLIKLHSGGIGLLYNPRIPNADWRYAREATFRRSDDGGKTWSKPVRCSPGYMPAFSLADVITRTHSGRIILPVYMAIGQGCWRAEDAPVPGGYYHGRFVGTDAHYFDPHSSGSYVCYSDDEGESWHVNRDGQLVVPIEYGGIIGGCAEPTVTEVSPGKLLMFMRTGLGRLFQAWSEDNGETWTRPEPSPLASDPSPAQLRTLSNGHLLCVWSQHGQEEIRRGWTRTRISSAISRNGGGIWEFFQNIESIHESVYVAPGPVEITRPVQVHALPGRPAAVFDSKYAQPLPEGFGRWSYPSVLVHDDRVLISHTYSTVPTDRDILPGASNS